MANWFVSSVAYNAIQTWAALTGGVATSVALGTYCRNTSPAAATGGNDYHRVFKCTTAGTTAATEPSTWSTTSVPGDGATTTDGTVVWTEVMGRASEQAAGNWKAPAYSSLAMRTSGVSFSSTDTIFFSSDHSESTGYGFGGWFTSTNVGYHLCVNRGAGSSMPPAAADLTTGAVLGFTQSGGGTVTLGPGYYYGLTFELQDTASADILTIGPSQGLSSKVTLENCSLSFSGTNAGNSVAIVGPVEFINTVLVLNGGAFSFISFNSAGSQLVWRDTPNAIQGTPPTGGKAFNFQNNGTSLIAFGCDFSGFGNSPTFLTFNSSNMCSVDIENCKLPSGLTTPTIAQGNSAADYGGVCIDNCSTASGINWNMARCGYMGQVLAVDTIYRSSGASDGATSIAWQFTTNNDARLNISMPLVGPEIATRYNTTGSSHTCTVEFLWNGSAALTDAQAWIEAEVMATASTPISTRYTSTGSNVLTTTGTTLTASTKAWNAPSRANSTAYTVGQAVEVPDNVGRVFFCTTAGTSAASEPAGYASAIDGGSVTDGTATFRAGWRLNASVTFTPEVAGVITVIPKFAVNNSAGNFYVDPYLTIV
jgi:hypothetical protein